METADAAYLALQCALSWINDLVSDSIFHAKTDLKLICLLQHGKKQAKQRFSIKVLNWSEVKAHKLFRTRCSGCALNTEQFQRNKYWFRLAGRIVTGPGSC